MWAVHSNWFLFLYIKYVSMAFLSCVCIAIFDEWTGTPSQLKRCKERKHPNNYKQEGRYTKPEERGWAGHRMELQNRVHFLLSFLLLRLEATKLVRIPARCRSEPAASLSSSSTSGRESLLLLFPKSGPCSGLRGHRARLPLSWSWCRDGLKLTGCEGGIWRGQGETGVLL